MHEINIILPMLPRRDEKGLERQGPPRRTAKEVIRRGEEKSMRLKTVTDSDPDPDSDSGKDSIDGKRRRKDNQ